MKRVFHHFSRCEENQAGMWRTITGDAREEFVAGASDLMRDAPRFKAAMMRAVQEWPYSCEMNLSASSINRQAWMGHAGNCIALNSPEELTRLGWHRLNQSEQDIANQMADEVIEFWEGEQLRKQTTECQNENLELMF